MDTVFLFCRDAAAGSDGRLNIDGIFNELYAPEFPARQERMVLAGIVEWPRDTKGSIPFRFDLVDPDGRPVMSIDGHTDVEPQADEAPPAKTQFVLPLENVLFTVAGQYRMRLTVEEQEIDGPSMYLMRAKNNE